MHSQILKQLNDQINNRLIGGGPSLDFFDSLDDFCAKTFAELEYKKHQPEYIKLLLIKISNIMAARFQYQSGHRYLLSRPFGLLVDPCNSCPLRCPGCIHNDYLRQNNEVDWPTGLLSKKLFIKFIRKFGPYAIAIHFFNWGEPFLNKLTPEFIRLSKNFGLDTVVSSNLNIKIDADSLVTSGLDFLIMSIDGITEKTYTKYRKGGDLNKAINNIKNIVTAKQRHQSPTPWLQWQFLTFEHNIAEIDSARKIANDLGINSIRFAKPYDVSWADTSIITNKEHLATDIFSSISAEKNYTADKLDTDIINIINRCFTKSWGKLAQDADSYLSTTGKPACQWLYKNMIMDANGRILPCCYAPRKNSKYTYVFSHFDENNSNDVFNSHQYLAARWNRKSTFFHESENLSKTPFCQECQEKGIPNINNDQINHYFEQHGLELSDGNWPDKKLISYLTNW